MSYTPKPRLHVTRARHLLGGVIFIGRRFDDILRLVIYGVIALCLVVVATAYGGVL